MKKIIFAVLMIIPTSSFAGMWQLISSDYMPEHGWTCTYLLSGSNYEKTITVKNMCPIVINN